MPSKGIFYLTPKRAYDTEMLLASADGTIDADDLQYVAKTGREDIRRAGSCLLFDEFTACGFHATRAVEATARRYYELIFGKEAIRLGGSGLPEPLTLGVIAMGLTDRYSVLKKAKTGTGTLGLVANNLERITRLYRNPIMHPEATLDEKSAITIFGATTNVISIMIEDVLAGGTHFQLDSALFGLRIA